MNPVGGFLAFVHVTVKQWVIPLGIPVIVSTGCSTTPTAVCTWVPRRGRLRRPRPQRLKFGDLGQRSNLVNANLQRKKPIRSEASEFAVNHIAVHEAVGLHRIDDLKLAPATSDAGNASPGAKSGATS